MRLKIVFLLVLVMGAESMAQTASRPQYSVTGRVVDSRTGAPLEHVRVHITSPGSETDYLMVETDRHGTYDFGVVEPGAYVLTLEKTGYLSELRGESRIHVSENSPVYAALRMMPANLITGRVLDERGEPMSHVMISLLKFSYTRNGRKIGISKQTTTDDRGEFRLFDLNPGNYLVAARSTASVSLNSRRKQRKVLRASSNGVMAYDTLVYPAWEPDYPDHGIHLIGGTEEHIEFHLRPTKLFSLSGTIRNIPNGGTPQDLRLVPTDRPALWLPESAVQSDGQFIVIGVSPGTYKLRASATNRLTTMAAEQSLGSTSTIVISEGNLTGVDVVLESAMAGVEARVLVPTDSPTPIRVDGLTFTRIYDVIDESMTTPIVPAKLDSKQSRFTATFSEPGTYFVDRVLTNNAELYVQSVKVNGIDVTNAGLSAGWGAFYPVEITLADDGASVNGTAIGSDGEIFAGAVVGLVPTGAASKRPDLFKTTTCDQKGTFSFTGIAPGAYRAVAFPPGTLNDAIYDPDQMKAADGTSVNFTLIPHGTMPLVMRLPLEAGDTSVKTAN